MKKALDFLVYAFILTFVGFDKIFIQGIKELFGINITINGYFTLMFIIGFMIEMFSYSYKTLRRTLRVKKRR